MADPTPDVATATAGWLVALCTAALGWLLRLLLGRHLKAYDDDRKEVRRFMKEIRDRLGKLEGRFAQQDADAAGGE